MEQPLNIDEFVDYRKEYSERLQDVTIKGNKLTSLCPFHNDRKATNFGVDLVTGKYNCFACGASGNYIRFRAQMEGIALHEATKKICAEYGKTFDFEPKRKQSSAPSGVAILYSVKEYAMEKRLPEEWLNENCGLEAKKDKDGNGYIYIPYWNTEGQKHLFRKRYPKAKGSENRFKWGYGSAGKIIMYGEWHIPRYYEDGYTFIVEGESDAQTMWYLGYNAMGVPGASLFKAEWVSRFGDISKIYIHKEPDQGGETFIDTMIRRLKQGEYSGKVFVWSCKQFEVKDPSELYIKYGTDEAKAKIRKAMSEAVEVNIYEAEIQVAIEDAPIHLRNPEGWRYDEKGIFAQDPKSLMWKLVCRTPIILTKRLKSLDTGEEKIEIAFKRDGVWQSRIFLRSTVFQSRNIVMLADMGCTITSENARMVVRFLEALEAENLELLNKAESTSTFGWQPGKRFLPGNGGDIVVDVEQTMMKWVNGFGEQGSLPVWIESMRKPRENPIFRFILASGFAAPLLKIVRCRNFMVYNWADSKGGKTATLKAALSIWGNPEQIMASFNATQVALERMAGIFNDLPMGLDERQLAGTRTEFIDKLVYMLSNGTGRIRGSKTGQLQSLMTWRSIIMATGEEPIINDKSMDGISSRMLELGGSPFSDANDAANMHKATADNYGFAGPAFIKRILKFDDETLTRLYEKIQKHLKNVVSDLDNNKISLLSLVATADTLSEVLFWRECKDIKAAAIKAIENVKAVIPFMTTQEDKDSTNNNAVEFVNEWLFMKASCFSSEPNDVLEWFGMIDDSNDMAYVLSKALHDALDKAGFNHRKTMKYMADQRIIEVDNNGKFAIVKKIGSRLLRVVKIDLKKIAPDCENDEQSDNYPVTTTGDKNTKISGESLQLWDDVALTDVPF